jgi:hypothetical protein
MYALALRSGVEIGNPGTLELRDHVLQHQLSLLEAAEHDLIHLRVDCKPSDDHIQILMLNAQLFESRNASENLSIYVLVH